MRMNSVEINLKNIDALVAKHIDALVAKHDEQDVDEFKRFQDDIERAIEPLQNQIVLHASAPQTWQELLQQAGVEIPSPISSEGYPASLSPSLLHKQSFAKLMIGAVVAGVAIGVVAAAIRAERFNGPDLSVKHWFAQPARTPPVAASADRAPTTPGDVTMRLSSQAQSADGQAGGIGDQRPAPPQAAISEAPPQPADLPQAALVAADNDRSSPPPNAEDASINSSVALPETGSALSVTPPSVTTPSVTTPPNDDPGLSSKFSDVQANREKPQASRDRPGAKHASGPKVLRPRAAVPDVSINRSSSSSRTKRLDQGRRKDHRDAAASLRNPAR
jgi:hypothetical protein